MAWPGPLHQTPKNVAEEEEATYADRHHSNHALAAAQCNISVYTEYKTMQHLGCNMVSASVSCKCSQSQATVYGTTVGSLPGTGCAFL